MAGISVEDVHQCWYSNTEQGQYIVMEASSIALPDKSQCPSPTPNISTQLCRLGPRSALLSRVVCSSLGPSPSFCSNCLNIMCFPINCAPNLIQSGLWAAFGFRLPFARRPQSNYCSRGDTRAPSLARAFSDRFVTRHDWRRRLNGVGSRRAQPWFNAIYVPFMDLSSHLAEHRQTMSRWMVARGAHTCACARTHRSSLNVLFSSN